MIPLIIVINLLPVLLLHHHSASKLCPCQTDISETNTELNDSSNLPMCTHKRHIWLPMRLSQHMKRWPNYKLEKSLHRNFYSFFHPDRHPLCKFIQLAPLAVQLFLFLLWYLNKWLLDPFGQNLTTGFTDKHRLWFACVECRAGGNM